MKEQVKMQMDAWLNEREEAIVEDLKTLLRFPTVFDPDTATAEMPYGQAIHDALMWLKARGESSGFDIIEGQGQYLVLSKQGAKADGRRVDCVSHVDVVSVDDAWTHPPFAAEEIDGRIYARGTQDMKTPLWMTIIALEMIQDLGLQHERDIRIVIGTDEESTMLDMEYYVEQEGLPDFMITPDGTFPLGIGEFGDLTVRIQGDLKSEHIASFETFNSENMICDRVDVQFKSAVQANVLAKIKASQVNAEELADGTIRFHGVAAHSSKPEKGDNALAKFFHFVAEDLGENWAEPFDKAFSPIKGTGLGYEADYQPMGHMTVNPSQAAFDGQSVNIVVDMRYPHPLDGKEILANIQGRFPDYDVTTHFHQPVTLLSEDDPYIQALLRVYDEWIGGDAKPYYTKGITYAKQFQGRGVVFGTAFDGDGMEGLAHERDEYFDRHLIPQITQTLAAAMIELANVKE
ncbi:hypothetical protein CL176_04835 [Suicoccus acidiformans]|uniref:Peptidase M20 dimerisation domain-containing protein n=1 Tax=Suicoccus acidiformans TaxID=2036206 RepID=A0A347WJX3_9LACT|nr:Sapep family Mn(2+)-dependent dipeptidase [Suicoccus acidiformans]AXY25380.1 hypothetical protein CL176_04835 [Suicoccus acidiformans]